MERRWCIEGGQYVLGEKPRSALHILCPREVIQRGFRFISLARARERGWASETAESEERGGKEDPPRSADKKAPDETRCAHTPRTIYTRRWLAVRLGQSGGEIPVRTRARAYAQRKTAAADSSSRGSRGRAVSTGRRISRGERERDDDEEEETTQGNREFVLKEGTEPRCRWQSHQTERNDNYKELPRPSEER